MNKKRLLFSCLLCLILVVSGCGTKQPAQSGSGAQSSQSASQAGKSTSDPTGQSAYAGTTNLQKFQSLATQNPKDDTAQINAGMSAYTNQKYDDAIEYYKKAIAINPKSGIAYNNIGNAYFRGKKDPKTALQYYVKATEIEPSYNYGWLNLALCQQALGDISGAKATVSKALTVLNSGDPISQSISQLQTQLNKK